MKRSILYAALLTLTMFAGSVLHAAAKDSDPEVFSTKGGKRDYTGVYPAHVKTIAVITPASYPNPKNSKRGVKLMEQAGYKVKIYPNAYKRPAGVEKNRYLSIPVELRVKDFEAAWCDMENDVILCARGGSGTEDLVAKVNWDKLPRRPELIVQGYSDVTMLLSALTAKGYGRPVAGVNTTSIPGLQPALIPEMKKMLHGQELKPIKLQTLVPGNCNGKLFAGLLSRFARAVKANYGLNNKGKIVIIEIVASTPAKIKEDLEYLLANKFFDGVSGVVFGHVLRSGDDKLNNQIIQEFSKKLNVPVYRGFPFGHNSNHLAIDFSRSAEIKDGVIYFPAVKK